MHSECVCVCVCLSVCLCSYNNIDVICGYVCIHEGICFIVYMCIFRVYVCIYMCVCVCVCVCVFVCVWAFKLYQYFHPYYTAVLHHMEEMLLLSQSAVYHTCASVSCFLLLITFS